MTEPFRLRFLADPHINSLWGVWPANFSYKGRPLPQNPNQQYLNDILLDTLNYPKPDLLVINGDVSDGKAPKDGGSTVMSLDDDCVDAAIVAALEPVVSGQKWYFFQGTPYHESRFQAIANALNPVSWPDGSGFGRVLDFTIRGKRVNVAHHPDGGSAVYAGTIMDRNLLWSIVRGAQGKVPNADIIVRSHNHEHSYFSRYDRLFVVTPCLQLPTPHAERRNYFRWQPDLGFVDILIREDEPPVVVPYKRDLPKRPVVAIEG